MKTPELTYDSLVATIDPEQEVEYTTSLNGHPFVITGPLDESLEKQIKADLAHDAKVATAPKPVEAPQAPVQRELAYEDFSTLKGREVARMKVSAWFYDRSHGTSMLALLNERIDNDRDVAFARGLGLLSVTRCAKHERAVTKLRGMDLTN